MLAPTAGPAAFPARQASTVSQDVPLSAPVTTVGSRGVGFTHAAFRGVTAREVTAIQLKGVGHYVAQEAPQLLADTLVEAFLDHD